jgi:hypothetical protein
MFISQSEQFLEAHTRRITRGAFLLLNFLLKPSEAWREELAVEFFPTRSTHPRHRTIARLRTA